jgi:hypothetical protein
MKKLLFGLFTMGFVTLSSFTTINSEDLVLHNCTYKMYSNGQYLGDWTLYGVPDNVSCNSSYAKQVAMDSWNGMH